MPQNKTFIDYLLHKNTTKLKFYIINEDVVSIRERHAAAKRLQNSLTCRDVVKQKVFFQTVKVIPSSKLRPRWRTMEVGVGDYPE